MTQPANEPTSFSTATATPQEVQFKKDEIARHVQSTDVAVGQCLQVPDSLRLEWQMFRDQFAIFYHAKSWTLPIPSPIPLPSYGLGSASGDMDQALKFESQLVDLQARLAKFCSNIQTPQPPLSQGGLWGKIFGEKAPTPTGTLDRVLTFAKWGAIIGGGVLALWAIWGIIHAKEQAKASERLAGKALERFPI